MRKPTDPRFAQAPTARSVAQALDGNAVLAGLLGGHRRAQALYARVRTRLPGPLATQVRAGPIDGATWTLLAAHGAAAAKLKHALPTLLAAAQESEPGITELRVKVLPPGP